MTGRPRTSTLVISGLFLAVLALYFLVRPVTPAETSAGAGQSATTTSPAAPKPTPTGTLSRPALHPRRPAVPRRRSDHRARRRPPPARRRPPGRPPRDLRGHTGRETGAK